MLLAEFSYATAALAYLLGWGVVTWRAGLPARAARVQLALLGSVAWAATLAAFVREQHLGAAQSPLLEFARYVLWLLAMPALVGVSTRDWFGRFNLALVLVAAMLAFLSPAVSLLLLSFAGLVNTEQLLRNAVPALRRTVKFYFVGLGGMFAYDLFLYSQHVLLGQSGALAWELRGFADALLVPFLVIALRKLSVAESRIYVSRQAALYSTAFIAVGVYLLATAAVGYAVRAHGGNWSEPLRVLFFVGAGLVLAVLLVADSPRRSLRVFLSKHFYRAKYDYRLEWLRFVGTLESREGEDVRVTSVRAVAQIIESPGGVLFLQDDFRGPYRASASWSATGDALAGVAAVDETDGLVQFLVAREWVIDVNEYLRAPEIYGDIALPEWLLAPAARWRIVSPFFERNRLLGFLVLQAPPGPFAMIFEDRDLLRTCGRHVATLLVQQAAERTLAESRQFDAFNRFAAFVMHDLKNSVAQLQLLVNNAVRHRNNPEFVNDAFGTIENTVARMTRLIEQLNSQDSPAVLRTVDAASVLQEAAQRAKVRAPVPVCGPLPAGLSVQADPERLGTVLDHIIRNAQDAAGTAGEVTLAMLAGATGVTITIADTGAGMDPAFVRERLFRPFDSTKGARGMGIGAHQAREYIRRIGGDVEVQSSPGAGTRFIVRLPPCPKSPRES